MSDDIEISMSSDFSDSSEPMGTLQRMIPTIDKAESLHELKLALARKLEDYEKNEAIIKKLAREYYKLKIILYVLSAIGGAIVAGFPILKWIWSIATTMMK